MKTGAKTSIRGSNSSYVEMANNMSEALKQTVLNSVHPSQVSKVVSQAVTSDNPDFRYIVGKDAAMIPDSRNMSGGEYKNLIKKQLNLIY